jgi:hypothetical protein
MLSKAVDGGEKMVERRWEEESCGRVQKTASECVVAEEIVESLHLDKMAEKPSVEHRHQQITESQETRCCSSRNLIGTGAC